MRQDTVPSHGSASPCQRPKKGVALWLPQSKQTHVVIPAETRLYVLISRAVRRDSGRNVHGLRMFPSPSVVHANACTTLTVTRKCPWSRHTNTAERPPAPELLVPRPKSRRLQRLGPRFLAQQPS